MNECENFGAFNFGAYVISNDECVNRIVANAYNSIIRGKNSRVERSTISSWRDDRVNILLCDYLKKFTHPSFKYFLPTGKKIDVTSSTIVSGSELSIQLIMPKKSISGIPVINSVGFGRNIFINNIIKQENNKLNDSLNLGNIYHMGNIGNYKVKLDKNSLTMHTLVTGSTGSGKSNTIYNMLDNLSVDVNFLIVEPAKGEYKHIFGHRKDVAVLGTNNKHTRLLKINPFKFEENIHILEHIDKLIEIFNVCWEMYAAMPAVLKKAIEKSYKDLGWNLKTSENLSDIKLYPNFKDVLQNLKDVITESDFAEELKSNYTGALVTRVESLTNGINGIIFSDNDIADEDLFDKNVIVDLSRVGSIETKAMIMGLLIMKLQEYRMSQGGMNNPLKHVTVLEEAHNILKRTSIEQNQEGSNLLGKSVEMLSNAIAEMRTYGEGFIIANQSPGMLDMSTIRNTNTKIILRLPDFSDRELVGKSASLSNEQINELSKLETGVCAIYQNNWLESVLCKVDKSNLEIKEFRGKEELIDYEAIKENIIKILLSKQVKEVKDFNKNVVIEAIKKCDYMSKLKIEMIKAIKKYPLITIDDISSIIYVLFYNKSAFNKALNKDNMDEWTDTVLNNMDNSIMKKLDIKYRYAALQCILKEEALKDEEAKEFYFKWKDYIDDKEFIFIRR